MESSLASDPQAPLLVQILSTILGGLLALAAAIYLAVRNSRAEHRRWLRQERLKAYSSFLETAGRDLDDVSAMFVASLHAGAGDLKAIQRRAEQTSDQLQGASGTIVLLGPQQVTEAAGAVRLSFGWSALDALSVNTLLDVLSDSGRDERRLEGLVDDRPTDRELVDRRVQAMSSALDHFKQVAGDEVQDRQARRLPFARH